MRPFEFSLWSFGALCKISYVNFQKAAASPVLASFHPVSTKLYRKDVHVFGRIQAVNFSGSLPNLTKVYGTLKISYLSYIASIHKAMLVSSIKR